MCIPGRNGQTYFAAVHPEKVESVRGSLAGAHCSITICEELMESGVTENYYYYYRHPNFLPSPTASSSSFPVTFSASSIIGSSKLSPLPPPYAPSPCSPPSASSPPAYPFSPNPPPDFSC